MGAYVLRRVLATVPVILLVTFMTFFALRILPGDPARAMLGEEASQERVDALRAELNLDRPLVVQYADWVASALRGDFGTSFRSGEPAAEAIWARLPVTLQITAMATALAAIISVPLGIVAATHRNGPVDFFATGVAVFGVAVPNFWFAMMLVLLFAVRLEWFPALGWATFSDDPLANLRHATLPVIAVALAMTGVLTRMTRTAMVEVLNHDYIRTARSKGLQETRVVIRHALRNALIPVVTILGLQVSALAGGTIIIETFFSIPGLGKLVIESVNQRDFVVIQIAVVLFAVTVSICNLAVDISYAKLDPRISY